MMTKYAWVIGLNAKLAPATVKLVYSYLVAVFRAAIRDRIVATSPRALNLPEVMRPLIKPLSPDEVERLQAELPERYRALVFFMAYTGLRPSEAFAVTNDRIDWMRGSLRALSLPGR